MATKDRTQVYTLGPSAITVDGVNVGYTADNVVLETETTDVQSVVADFGDTPLDTWHLAVKARLKFTAKQIDFATYERTMQGFTRIASGSNEAIGAGKTAGARLTAVEVVVTPMQTEVVTTKPMVLQAWRCVPRGSRAIKWDAANQSLDVELELQIHETKTEGEKLFRFGHTSVTADSSAPTVTTFSPVDGATGVSTAVAPTILWDGAMDAESITDSGKQAIVLVKSTSVGVEIPVAITITHNTTTHTTTVTPTSALAGTTEYDMIVTWNCKDSAGNRYVGGKISFTTT